MCKYVTRDCLQRIYDGCNDSDGVNNPSNNVVLGTILYFTIMWHYKHIVCSEAATLGDKVKNADVSVTLNHMEKLHCQNTKSHTNSKLSL